MCVHVLSRLAATQAQAQAQAQRWAVTWAPSAFGSGWTDGKMRQRDVLPLWVLALLGLTCTGVGLRSQSLEFFHREMELSHLIVDETSGT